MNVLQKITDLWYSNANFSLVTTIFLTVFFGVTALFCYGITWYFQMSSMAEYGYPKISRKTFQKRFKQYTTVEKIMLTKLKRFATKKGFMLQLCWMINLLNLLFAVISSIGLIGFVITHGSGWSVVLSFFLPFESCLLFVAIRFIPDLIWLPSERRRYFRK